ncbi:MAG TPA: hypothetical protein DCM28_21695 [Phycisphaerales bacterium]|nr:hypothetical protein [Phycisphaerales bacterium]
MHTYFRHPFPSRKAFGPYASPGMTVHLPAIFLGLMFGWVLGHADMGSLPVLIATGFCSVYLGRDLAIRAHYNVLVTVGVFVTLLFCLSVGLPWLNRIHQWAGRCSYGWPSWIYALILIMLTYRQAKLARHQTNNTSTN